MIFYGAVVSQFIRYLLITSFNLHYLIAILRVFHFRLQLFLTDIVTFCVYRGPGARYFALLRLLGRQFQSNNIYWYLGLLFIFSLPFGMQ